jgi:hypothetical protein
MDIDIFETINEIAQNEHEKFKAFRERFIEYCEKEQTVVTLFRVLKGIELELNDCIAGRVNINADRAIVEKLLKVIRTELTIVRYKMRYPAIIELALPKVPQPVEWIGDKIELIELIYAIYTVNKKKIPLTALQDCFEYIFKVKLGNISGRFYQEIAVRKGGKIQYLAALIEGLNNFLNSLND